MRRLTVCLFLFMFVFLWGEVKSGAEVEDILQALQAHMDNIKTVKGKFKIEITSYEREGDKNTLLTGDYLYDNGNWRMKIKGKQWGEGINHYKKELENTGRFLATEFEKEIENKGQVYLSYVDQHKIAVVQKKLVDNPYMASTGLFFAGILSSDYFGTPITTFLKETLEKGLCKIEVKVLKDTGIIQLDIKYLNEEGKEKATGLIEIDPLKQYSVLKEEFKTVEDLNYEKIGKVEFELIDPPGIYFPKKATFEIKQGKPLQTTDLKSFEFYDTRVNEEIMDNELEVILPAGVQVKNELTQDLYITFKEMTLEQILSGDCESIERKLKPTEYLEKAKEIMEAVKRVSGSLKEFVGDKSKVRVSPSVMSEILYIPELIYDAGKIIEPSEIAHKFEIYNRSDKPIGIKIQHYSCGVTTATLSSSPIPAGGKSLLTVKINPAGYKGEIEAGVTVVTDAPDLNKYNFYLTAFMCTGVRCVPEYIDLGNMEYGKKYRQTIKVEAFTTGKPLKIRSYNTDNEMFKIVKVIDNEDYKYEKLAIVEIAPTRCGKIAGNLWFTLDDDSSTVVSAKMAGEVIMSSLIHPAGIFLMGKSNSSGEIKMPRGYCLETKASSVVLEKGMVTEQSSVYKYNVKIPADEKKRFSKAGEIKVKNENNEVVYTIPVFY
ncbi:MAG: DUF1573 domain-containing protein [Candidatus Sumerlaeia bacterium]|nr:DUF1573 domain-containing protein [Candidatus Sumerlaeia bacterium]